MRLPVSSGRVHIHELLDLVAATDGKTASVGEAVRHLYDWHNSRSVTGLQLTFAPAATAILAIVAKPGSTVLIIVAGAVVLVTLVLGVLQLLALNWLQGEYVYAVRLAMEIRALYTELVPYPHGFAAPEGSAARALYDYIGPVAMVAYGADPGLRDRVLGLISVAKYAVSSAP